MVNANVAALDKGSNPFFRINPIKFRRIKGKENTMKRQIRRCVFETTS